MTKTRWYWGGGGLWPVYSPLCSPTNMVTFIPLIELTKPDQYFYGSIFYLPILFGELKSVSIIAGNE